MPASNSKLTTYRIRFRVGGVKHLVVETVKAVSLDAALDWAEDYLTKNSLPGEVYDAGPINPQ